MIRVRAAPRPPSAEENEGPLNAYFETDVRNRPSGVKVTLRISKLYPPRQE
jgi:hypothetical protein